MPGPMSAPNGDNKLVKHGIFKCNKHNEIS